MIGWATIPTNRQVPSVSSASQWGSFGPLNIRSDWDFPGPHATNAYATDQRPVRRSIPERRWTHTGIFSPRKTDQLVGRMPTRRLIRAGPLALQYVSRAGSSSRQRTCAGRFCWSQRERQVVDEVVEFLEAAYVDDA
jgi:hypothetical protein